MKNGISISINSSSYSWYEKYRIDETPYNEAYHSLKLKDCPVLKCESEIIDNKKEEPKPEQPKAEFKKKVFKIRRR